MSILSSRREAVIVVDGDMDLSLVVLTRSVGSFFLSLRQEKEIIIVTFSGIYQIVVTRGSGKTHLVSEGLVSEGLGKANSDHDHHPTASLPHAISDSSDIFSSTSTNE